MNIAPESRRDDVVENLANRRIFHSTNGYPDSAVIRVIPDLPPLRYDDAELYEMTKSWSDPVVSKIPGFRYWETDAARRMDQPKNICGDHQRAFDFYWSIKSGVQKGGISLGIGTTSVAGPATLGTDKHWGDNQPHERYRGQGTYAAPPYMFMDADETFPFFDEQFFGAAANHVLEHMRDIFFTLGEMLRVTRKECPVWFIMPDMTYSSRGSIDPTHTREWSSDEFWHALEERESSLPPFEVVAWNTLDNAFSFDGVLLRR